MTREDIEMKTTREYDGEEGRRRKNLNLKHKQTCENVKQAIVTSVIKLYEKISISLLEEMMRDEEEIEDEGGGFKKA